MDDLLEQAEQIVDLIRSQNWKNGGCLSVDRPDAIAVVQQIVRTAYSAGQSDAAQTVSTNMLAALDAANAGAA